MTTFEILCVVSAALLLVNVAVVGLIGYMFSPRPLILSSWKAWANYAVVILVPGTWAYGWLTDPQLGALAKCIVAVLMIEIVIVSYAWTCWLHARGELANSASSESESP